MKAKTWAVSAVVLWGRSHNVVRYPEMPPEAFADLWDTPQSGRAWMGLVKNRCRNVDESASGDELSRRTGAVCKVTDFVRAHAQRAETTGGDLSRLAHDLDGLAGEFWRQAHA